MSRWIDRILKEFPADISRLWIAADPDDVLLDERILSGLRERGFEVLPFEDSVAFRTEYEERYRAAWDRREPPPSSALILHLQGTDRNVLPWDYLRQSREVSLSLANLFPKLSYGVVRQIGAEHREALFDAQSKHAKQQLGESDTKNFILTHIFRLSPYLISRPEDLWRELLRLHYRGAALPPMLASHVAVVLTTNVAFRELPIAELFASKSLVLRVVQVSWDRFIAQHGATGSRPGEANQPEAGVSVIPFDHPDVRVFVDSMFLDGTIQPLPIQGSPAGVPEWARLGIVQDPSAIEGLVAEAIERLGCSLPELEASHRDWAQAARRLGEVIFRFHSLSSARAECVRDKVHALQAAADERLRAWVHKHYADLPSLPAAKGPVMVHHVPRFLALRRDSGETRVALLVIDGMAMDQWLQIRECLAQRAPGLGFDESACFAWLPTLTSVSRQALFSGRKPREFASSIETTAQEPSLWSQFWQDHGLRANEVLYRRGIKRPEQLPELEEALADTGIKAAAIVVDTIDEIVHGAILGKRGIASQIASWCETGFFDQLLALLLDKGFHIYITADHGNVEASGIGRPNQGVASELRGERVRTYRTEAMAEATAASHDAFRIDIPGLPSDFLPLFAGARGAFVQQGERIVAHGGLSVEELVVPFVRLDRVSAAR
jgi:hypothetical protein